MVNGAIVVIFSGGQHPHRPSRGDALFLPAWSRWPLTATAGRCVLAVELPTFEDHEVTHQARRPWRRIDQVARKTERSSALAD
jgi:hypothetical protein